MTKFFAKFLLAFTIVTMTILPACCQMIEQVELLEARGTTYQVIEVTDHDFEDRKLWQKALGVGGKKFYTFRQHASDYPLKVYAADLPKDFKLPDHRKYFVRHPRQKWALDTGVNTALLIWNIASSM